MAKGVSIFLMCIILSGALPSCKKYQKETPYTRIEGRWKLTNTAVDDNANGTIDANEIHKQDPNIDDQIIFRLDSTGVETVVANGVVDSYKFNYVINENVIHYIGAGNDVRDYYIENVTSSNLELTETLSLGLAGFFFEKK